MVETVMNILVVVIIVVAYTGIWEKVLRGRILPLISRYF